MIKDAIQFLKEVRVELSKVVWPKTPAWIESTTVVLVLVFLFSCYLGLIDKLLSNIVGRIFKYFG